MTVEEKIDEMCRQLMTAKSKKKICELKRGIEKAEQERRRLKRKAEGIML